MRDYLSEPQASWALLVSPAILPGLLRRYPLALAHCLYDYGLRFLFGEISGNRLAEACRRGLRPPDILPALSGVFVCNQVLAGFDPPTSERSNLQYFEADGAWTYVARMKSPVYHFTARPIAVRNPKPDSD